MRTVKIELPDEVVQLLAATRLGEYPADKQVRIALALYLFERELISFGKAAELADEPRGPFQLLAAELGVPAVRYDLADHEQDVASLKDLVRPARSQ
ncbi:MAG: UPF0175 family protein [Dehalococcoidia bacterium]